MGGEVIRRHCHEPANAGEAILREAAVKTATDEGYNVDPLNVVFA